MGMFIAVEIDRARCAPDTGAGLVAICPVKIFVLKDGQVGVDSNNEDECTLCGLCQAAYPEGIRIRRIYRDE